jgi:hypothetical protein
MATMVALFDAATEDCGLADRDLSQRSFLLSGERVSNRREVSWTVDAEMSASSSAGAFIEQDSVQPDAAVDPGG